MDVISDLPPRDLREQVTALRDLTREHSRFWLLFTSRGDTGSDKVAVRVEAIDTRHSSMIFPPARQVLILAHRRGAVLRARDVRLIRGLLAQHGRLAVELREERQTHHRKTSR